MGSKPDYVRKKYGPLIHKSLQTALAHAIGEQFPRIGGPRILALCAEMILQVVFEHLRPREHLTHGQVLWMAIHRDDPPAQGKTIDRTRLVPVVLDLSLPEDIERRIARQSKAERLLAKALRLCRQAYEQEGLLSNCDLAELLGTHDGAIAAVMTTHERESGELVPRRATLHDVGTGLTHKRIICWKRYAEGKTSEKIAAETYHSIEAVDRYLGQFDRVRNCRELGMTPEKTAYTLQCGVSLVKEYLEIDRLLKPQGEAAPDA